MWWVWCIRERYYPKQLGGEEEIDANEQDDNLIGEAEEAVDNLVGEAEDAVDNLVGEAEEAVDNLVGEAEEAVEHRQDDRARR